MSIFYWSSLEIILWGIITRYLQSVGGEKFGFITVIVGAVIFWNFFNRVQNTVSVSFLEDVWSRNLINLFSSPLKISEYLAGLIMVAFVSTLLSFAGMILLAWFLLSYNIFQFGFLLVPFVLLLYLFGFATGIATTAVVLRYGPSVEVVVWSVTFILMPFSGIFYPISALPPFLRPVSYVIPISYVFEGMRNAVIHGIFDMSGFIIAFFLSLVYLAASLWFFVRMYRIALKKGLFTRFMTE